MAIKFAGDSLSQQAFNQLTGVRAIKKAQIEAFFEERRGDMGVLVDVVESIRDEGINKLIAVRETKRIAVEAYFDTASKQVQTMSNDPAIVAATQDFQAHFKTYSDDLALAGGKGLAEMRAAVKSYWTDQYGEEYQEQNDGAEADIDGLMAKLGDQAVVFQYKGASKNSLFFRGRLESA